MTHQEFENYLEILSKLLRLGSKQREEIGSELRDHLELRVAELVESGESQAKAVHMALSEFGDAASMANQFSNLFKQQKRRWMMRFATLSVAGLFLGAVFVMSMWPADARFGTPSHSIAQVDETADAESDRTTRPTRFENNLAVQNFLNSTRADFDFIELTFSDLLLQLSDTYPQLQFLVDPSIEDGDLDANTFFTLDLNSILLSSLLEITLTHYDCTYAFSDGVVIILHQTLAEEERYQSVQVFPIPECLTLLDAQDAMPPWRSTIETMVSPDSWESAGGAARIRVINNTLIVKASPRVLSQVADLLEHLESIETVYTTHRLKSVKTTLTTSIAALEKMKSESEPSLTRDLIDIQAGLAQSSETLNQLEAEAKALAKPRPKPQMTGGVF